MRRIHYVYLTWLVACIAAVFGFRDAPDPSRFSDRISDAIARRHALSGLYEVDADRYRSFVPVSAAWSRAGELGVEARWVVLCDEQQRTGLADAVVVEIDGHSGEVLRLRSGIGP